MTDIDINCSDCGSNNWRAWYEDNSDDESDDNNMLFLLCECGHVWTAQLE